MGGERVLFLSAASWAAITAVTPLLAQLGTHPLAAMTTARFLMGLLQGEYCTCDRLVRKNSVGVL